MNGLALRAETRIMFPYQFLTLPPKSPRHAASTRITASRHPPDRSAGSVLSGHGLRHFRDWAAERTDFPRDVAELALAHTIGDKVEVAYRRGDLFNKRHQLMEAWATYCGTTFVTRVEPLGISP